MTSEVLRNGTSYTAEYVSDFTGDTREKNVVLARLEETRFAPNFGGDDGEGAELEDVAAFLQSLTGINFIISPKVRDELDVEETTIEALRAALQEGSDDFVSDLHVWRANSAYLSQLAEPFRSRDGETSQNLPA